MIVHSFYDSVNEIIRFVVEDTVNNRVLWMRVTDSIVNELGSAEGKYKQGFLEVIFTGGRVNQCIGCGFQASVTEPSSDWRSDEHDYWCEFELEYHPDGKIYEVHFNRWDDSETSYEYHYDEKKDRIV